MDMIGQARVIRRISIMEGKGGSVNTALILLMFLLGLVLTVKGGDLFVDAASWMAEVSGIPKFIIGATIVSLCTTLPELLVSLMASASGSIGIAVGNAVGSVNANLGLIMGISAVCAAGAVKRRQQAVKYVTMAAAIVLMLLFSLGGRLSIAGAVVLLLLFAANMAESALRAKKSMNAAPASRPQADRHSTAVNLVKFVLGIAGIVIGARLLVDYGTKLAQLLGVPDSVIGATLVAVGTSLPELVTTIAAIVKKQSSLSIGNIVGANIIDLTLILPLCSIVSGRELPILAQNIRLDMPVCLGLSLLAIVPPLITGRFRRAQGVVLLGCYAAYIVVLCLRIPGLVG